MSDSTARHNRKAQLLAMARRSIRSPRFWLCAYAIALVLIAIWPVPVDRGAGPFLKNLTHVIPWLTYTRIEFAANIVFFVPLGFLLALLLPGARYLVVPIAVVTTVAVESVQGLALDQRTASVHDIIANVAGACVGLLLAAALERLRERQHPQPRTVPLPSNLRPRPPVP